MKSHPFGNTSIQPDFVCLLPKQSLDMQIYTLGKRTHSFPVACLTSNGSSIQRPPAASPHDESLATGEHAVAMHGSRRVRCRDAPAEWLLPPTLPRAQETQLRLERAPMPTLLWAPAINPAQRRSHPSAFFLPHLPGCKEKRINNASEDLRSGGKTG